MDGPAITFHKSAEGGCRRQAMRLCCLRCARAPSSSLFDVAKKMQKAFLPVFQAHYPGRLGRVMSCWKVDGRPR